MDYNTALSPEEQQGYEAWAKGLGKTPRDEEEDYDLPGYYKWQLQNPQPPDARGHLTDQFKKPNHPTFSDQSQYHGVNGEHGGSWTQSPDGSYTFTAGPSNLGNWGVSGLQDYFKKYEPGNKLVIPDGY
jgi:hypothetical protein